MNDYQESLIYSESEDGLDHCGLLIRPVHGQADKLILWIHGNTGNFYDYPYVVLGRTLAQMGFAFISANTRGHDLSTYIFNIFSGERVAAGSALEKLDQAPLDLGGWIGTAERETGIQRFILVGHSQGAVKVLQYQAERKDSRIIGLVLASPDLKGHWPAELVQQAQAQVDAGQADALMPPLMNTPTYRLSAANVLSREYARHNAYEADDGWLSQIMTPLLVIYGDNGDIGGQAEIERIESKYGKDRLRSCLIAGADHVYFDKHEAAAGLIADWANGLT